MENIGSIVIIKKFPFSTHSKSIFPLERENEINGCNNEKVKKEKYYVWMLLQDSLKQYYDFNIEEAEIKKESNGKWTSNKFNFSLSHSKNLVAVAISFNCNIGVDIQERKNVAIAKMIKNKNDFNIDNDILFSMKEAIYKSTDGENFVPKKIETKNSNSYVFDISSNKEKFVLSVACKESISLFTGSGVKFQVRTIKSK